MGFMDKVKDIGKKALKTALISANDWCGKVMTGEYDGTDLKDCLVGTDTQGGALVFYKGVDEVCRIPVTEVGYFYVKPNIQEVTAVTSFLFKDDSKKGVGIYTKFNTGTSGTKIPGVYLNTEGSTYLKFIDFLKLNTLGPVEGTAKDVDIIVDLVKRLKQIHRG